jgi:hypothetical protein
VWVFDDDRVGLVREPFVSGADIIIDKLVSDIPNAEDGFALLFSARPFPGHNAVFQWLREEVEGNWYFCPELQLEGWLCPALFHYFESAPAKLYAQFRAKVI